ncbi:MAG: TonB-dependent receptor [Gemmatimonadota bacterium]
MRGLVAVATLILSAWLPMETAAQRGRSPDGVVAGQVLDADTEQPLLGAEVGLEGTDLRVVTGDDGRFRLVGVSGGSYRLWVRRIGYQERFDSLMVPPQALVGVTIVLSTDPIVLEELVVTVRSPALARHGFYARQEQRYEGIFIDRAEIERRQPQSVTDIFRNVPGLRVTSGGIYGSKVFVDQRVSFNDANLRGCEPLLWLDGIRSTMPIYDLMRAEEIEGIEIYSGESAPGKFNHRCGTIVIWTRYPFGRPTTGSPPRGDRRPLTVPRTARVEVALQAPRPPRHPAVHHSQ